MQHKPGHLPHPAHPRLRSRSERGRHRAVVPREDTVLVLPREVGALETQRGRQYPLHVVGHVVGALPRRARRLRRQLVKERHLVHRTRVHEEEYGVHRLPSPRRRRVEEPQPVVHRDGHDPIRQLCEERTEPEQEGLAARGALGADHQIALGELGLYALRVDLAVAAEADGADRGEDLREAGDGVGHGGDFPAEYHGEDHRVHEGAVGADEEDSGFRRRGRGWRAAADDDGPAEYADDVRDEAHGED